GVDVDLELLGPVRQDVAVGEDLALELDVIGRGGDHVAAGHGVGPVGVGHARVQHHAGVAPLGGAAHQDVAAAGDDGDGRGVRVAGADVAADAAEVAAVDHDDVLARVSDGVVGED